MLKQLLRRFAGDTSGEMLRTTAKAAAVAGLFSVSAAYVLSDRLETDKRALDILASSISAQNNSSRPSVDESRPGVDMTTTGSIRNQSVRLDPCEVPAKR